MKALPPASSQALAGAAGLILLVGLLVMSPSGAFLTFGVAALPAAIAAVFGSGKSRLVASVLLLAAIYLAAGQYANFRAEQERYRQRAKSTRLTSIRAADSDGTARF
ncbi:MAG: hypothetical protein PSW75_11820 [bacterium]|nr:hypothetical protein [bacterium]MDI1335737.1 hypothetical protein [Lacunisphaera sp.]